MARGSSVRARGRSAARPTRRRSPGVWPRKECAIPRPGRSTRSREATRAARSLGFPVVIKPARGAGCAGVTRVRREADLPAALARAQRAAGDKRALVQRFVSGTAASVALLSDGRRTRVLAVSGQTVAGTRLFSYAGGETPLTHPQAARAAAMARRTCRGLPGLKGYVGVDVVLADTEAFVIEVNPRLTTSYLGVRASLGENVAGLALLACAGALGAVSRAPPSGGLLGRGPDPLGMTDPVLGWDIGGANVKAALVSTLRDPRVVERPFALWREPRELPRVLGEIAGSLGGARRMAVTMTAELADCFATKGEGVASVLDAFGVAFPDVRPRVFGVDGRFRSSEAARARPLRVAAANWMASAMLVAEATPDALFVDVGSTTTDIIPIVAGRVVPHGRTDVARLRSGELVYTGLLRTPVCAIVRSLPVRGRRCRVAAELFAIAADAHRWLGHIAEERLRLRHARRAGPVAGGSGGTPGAHGLRRRRSPRARRGDRDRGGRRAGAGACHREGHRQVTQRRGDACPRLAVLAGQGTLPGAPRGGAGRSRELHPRGALRARGRARPPRGGGGDPPRAGERRVTIDAVVKVGGSLLARDDLAALVASLSEAAASSRIVVVPGGGPFADAVRDVTERNDPGDSAAHWMAILAMDQHAHLLAGLWPGGRARRDALRGIAATVERGRLAILAPFNWLRSEDPTPHGWHVTSDSIAAWVAARLAARRLVLLKSVEGALDEAGAVLEEASVSSPACGRWWTTTFPRRWSRRSSAGSSAAGTRSDCASCSGTGERPGPEYAEAQGLAQLPHLRCADPARTTALAGRTPHAHHVHAQTRARARSSSRSAPASAVFNPRARADARKEAMTPSPSASNVETPSLTAVSSMTPWTPARAGDRRELGGGKAVDTLARPRRPRRRREVGSGGGAATPEPRQELDRVSARASPRRPSLR